MNLYATRDEFDVESIHIYELFRNKYLYVCTLSIDIFDEDMSEIKSGELITFTISATWEVQDGGKISI